MMIKARTTLLLLLLIPALQASAETHVHRTSTMMPILPPDLPPSTTLQDSLRQPTTPPPTVRTKGYLLDTSNRPAYLDLRQDEQQQDFLTPQWELFRWKSSTGEH